MSDFEFKFTESNKLLDGYVYCSPKTYNDLKIILNEFIENTKQLEKAEKTIEECMSITHQRDPKFNTHKQAADSVLEVIREYFEDKKNYNRVDI